MRPRIRALWRRFRAGLTCKRLLLILLGALICTFGIHNIHQRTHITEDGVIGLMLLLEHWLDLSPAYLTPVLDALCYLLAFRFLGGEFLKISAISTLFVSLCYKLWELFPPMLPDLSAYPLLAAVCGAVFVGVGVGLIVRQGGSSGGDDALALTISHAFRCRLSFCYLLTDLTVLALSLTYIPPIRIAYSLVTVTISSVLIDLIQKPKNNKPRGEA